MISSPGTGRASGIAAGALAVFLLLPAGLQAQSVEDLITTLAMENAEAYAEPVLFGLGYAMNGSLFDSPRALGRFSFDVGARAMFAIASDEAKTFEAILPAEVGFGGVTFQDPYAPRDGSLVTPTAVAGDQEQGVVLEPQGDFRQAILLAGEDPEDFNIQFPPGLDVRAIPFLVAHGSLGLGFGTEVTLRGIPEVELSEGVGSVSSFGFGIKHEVTNWFPAAPVNVSVVYGRQSFKVGDFVDASSNQYGAVVGRGFGPLTLYGTGMVRDADVDITYTVENPDDIPGLPADGTEIAFSRSLSSDLVFGVGAQLRLLLLNLSAQFTADEFSTLAVKVGIGLP